ncbi:MAG: SMC-Scp complex subunit ScpB [Ignavibacteriaceae bacterium]|nr:SMC-Scp complex subunit ScpB [Ignavibacteriaceae bacterium]
MDNIYNSVIEALIFSSDDPITSQEIIKAIKGIDGDDSQISNDEVDNAVDELNKRYEELGISFCIQKIAHGFLFSTKPDYSKYVGYLSSEKSKRRLSQAALETLAIIAYKQPLTKPELEIIRGVNADYIITTLLEKNLITISGRAETIGRPLLYNTTDEFLKYFGLHKITDLPKPREIEDIMKDEDFLEQRQKIMMNAIEEQVQNELNTEGENDNAPE